MQQVSKVIANMHNSDSVNMPLASVGGSSRINLPSQSFSVSLPGLKFDSTGYSKEFLKALEEYFELNAMPKVNKFKLSLACLSGKANSWVKVTLNPEPLTNYNQLKKRF